MSTRQAFAGEELREKSLTVVTASVTVTFEVVPGLKPGAVTVMWNGRDGRGRKVRRGTYVVRVAATSELGLTQLAARVSVR